MAAASADLKSKEEKDAELDRRIEALRRKNQALIKRHQEIEEDRRKAEQEGVAVTRGRRPPSPGRGAPEAERRPGEAAGGGGGGGPSLAVQVLLSPQEKRVVSSSERHPPTPHRTSRSNASPRGPLREGGSVPDSISPGAQSPPEKASWEGAARDGRRRGGGRKLRARGGPAGDAGPDRRSKEWEERRRQNIEKMNEEMERIAEYERSQRDGLQEKNPVRNFLDDPRRSGPFAECDRRNGSRRHMRNWGGADFDKVKAGMEQGQAWAPPGRGRGSRRRAGALDMTLSMTGRERAEYIRWKREREQIDRERLARHRQATGEWRREWDAEKMDTLFKEGARPGGAPGIRLEESKSAPKLPTLGAFLPDRGPERRRKGRGQGRTRSTPPSKPYSMHDNRWEEEEEELEAPPLAEGKSDAAPAQEEGQPASPHVAVPDEDEDQWEDVSEEEEEEEEEEPVAEAPPSGSPRSRDGPLSLAMPPPELEASSVEEAKPLTPFSPAEGHHPVSDWGEEMELSSPRTDCPKSLSAEEEEEEQHGPPQPGERAAAVGVAPCLAPRTSGGSSRAHGGGGAEIPGAQQEKAEV